MEFVTYQEAMDALRHLGVKEIVESDERLHLQLPDGPDTVHLHLACPESACSPRKGANVISVNKDQLANTVEHLIHKLRLREVLVIPVGKWRKVFDAVAFSMASHEDWQEVDTMATVELNTRDPLLCEPGDFHTLNALIKSLFTDADSPDQGLMLTTSAAPVMMEIVPDGAVLISVGDPVLADEVAETVRG